MFKKQQNGFTLFEIILVIALVAALAALGWMGYQNSRNNEAPVNEDTAQTEEQTPQETPPEEQEEEAAQFEYSGEMVASGDDKFSLKVPAGWSITNCDNADWLYVRYENDKNDSDLTYTQGESVSEESIDCYGFGDILKFSVRAYGPDGSLGVTAPDVPSDGEVFMTDSGVEGTKKCVKNEKTFTATITKGCSYYFSSGNVDYVADYRIVEGDKDRTELVEAAIKTLQLTP